MEKTFVISNELFALEENTQSILILSYHNLSSMNTPVLTDYQYLENIHYSSSVKPALSDVRELMTVTSAYVIDDVIYATTESVMGQKKYAITIDANKVIHTELLSDAGFERSIFTIQPLN